MTIPMFPWKQFWTDCVLYFSLIFFWNDQDKKFGHMKDRRKRDGIWTMYYEFFGSISILPA